MIKLEFVDVFYSVVLLGGFNPMNFHPFWLLQKKLISEIDVTEKQILVNDQLSTYHVGDWLDMTVTRNRCEFKIKKEERVIMMRDLIVGTLNALPEMPITAIGINRGSVYNLANEYSYYEFGAQLAPLNKWEPSFHNPRLRNIAIEDIGSESFKDKRRMIQIKPAEVKGLQYCVDFNINNHYDLVNVGQTVPKALSILTHNMESDFDTFQHIIDALVLKMNEK